MKRNSLLIVSLVCIFVTALLHILAISFYIYWTFPWFDTIVHGLGGTAVGFFALWLDTSARFEYVPKFSFSSLMVVLGGTLFIGLLWELFEVSTGITLLSSSNYVSDTFGDLIMDVVGGCIALTLVGFSKKK